MSLRMIFNEELPPDLREALDSDAQAREMTTNDAASRILAEHYSIAWERSGFPYRQLSPRFKLRVGPELHQAIRMDAASRLITIRGIVLSLLSEHYLAVTTDPARRPRREVA